MGEIPLESRDDFLTKGFVSGVDAFAAVTPRFAMAFSRPTAHAAGHVVAGPAAAKHQIAGLYDLGETLGEGHYAVVKLASHVFTGEKVAVKVIDKLKLDSATRVQMLQEVQLMKLVQHPHVVRLYEVSDYSHLPLRAIKAIACQTANLFCG